MHEMDMIPTDLRHAMRLRRALRVFFGACAAVVVVVALVRAGVGYLASLERAELVRLEQGARLRQIDAAKLGDLARQKQAIERQLATLDALSGGERLARLLRAIDNAYEQGVWLDKLQFVRDAGAARPAAPGTPSVANPAAAVPGGPAGEQAIEVSHGAHLVGHASDFAALGEFIRKLGAQPGVIDIRLNSTGTRGTGNVQTADFNLSLKLGDDAAKVP